MVIREYNGQEDTWYECTIELSHSYQEGHKPWGVSKMDLFLSKTNCMLGWMGSEGVSKD